MYALTSRLPRESASVSSSPLYPGMRFRSLSEARRWLEMRLPRMRMLVSNTDTVTSLSNVSSPCLMIQFTTRWYSVLFPSTASVSSAS
eukprot:756461-Hanusia_phi.AAC.9